MLLVRAFHNSVLTSWIAECNDAVNQQSLQCGLYSSACQATPARTVNFEESILFYGAGIVGSFQKTYTQFAPTDRFCNTPTLQYVFNGTYALHGPSDCGGYCTLVRVIGLMWA